MKEFRLVVDNCTDVEDSVKEEVLDDIETIEEQVNSKEPKVVKIKKAWNGIINFIKAIPKMATGVLAANSTINAAIPQLQETYQKLEPIIGKFIN